MKLVTITDQSYAPLFCNWINEKFEDAVAHPDTARTIACAYWDEDGKLEIVTVAAFNNWTKAAAEVHIATDGSKRQKADRKYIWNCLNYVFNFAGKECLVAHIAVKNVKSLAIAEWLGLTKVGIVKDFYGTDSDAVLLTLTKREWQQGYWAELEEQEKEEA
jgi:hypothetical protein